MPGSTTRRLARNNWDAYFPNLKMKSTEIMDGNTKIGVKVIEKSLLYECDADRETRDIFLILQ